MSSNAFLVAGEILERLLVKCDILQYVPYERCYLPVISLRIGVVFQCLLYVRSHHPISPLRQALSSKVFLMTGDR